jgi:hypothetical protein
MDDVRKTIVVQTRIEFEIDYSCWLNICIEYQSMFYDHKLSKCIKLELDEIDFYLIIEIHYKLLDWFL